MTLREVSSLETSSDSWTGMAEKGYGAIPILEK